MDSIFQSLGSILQAQSDLFIKPQSLAAIWLEKSVITGQGKTCRIAPDATVMVQDGVLVDCVGKPSHKVIGCFGTLVNQFELTLIRLADGQPDILKL